MSGLDRARRRLHEFWNRDRDYYERARESNLESGPEREFLFGFLDGGERVLDVGCGSCQNARWLPQDSVYFGVDLSTVGLVMAAESDLSTHLLRANGDRLPIADRSFDAVLSTWAIEHFHDPGQTLAEMIRVLKPEGHLLLDDTAWDLPYTIPPSIGERRRFEVAWRRLNRQIRSLVDGRHRFDVVTEPLALSDAYVPDSDAVAVIQSWFLRRYLEDAGMRIVEHREIPHETSPALARRAIRRMLGAFSIWRHGWGNLLIVAKRVEVREFPEYELNYL